MNTCTWKLLLMTACLVASETETDEMQTAVRKPRFLFSTDDVNSVLRTVYTLKQEALDFVEEAGEAVQQLFSEDDGPTSDLREITIVGGNAGRYFGGLSQTDLKLRRLGAPGGAASGQSSWQARTRGGGALAMRKQVSSGPGGYSVNSSPGAAGNSAGSVGFKITGEVAGAAAKDLNGLKLSVKPIPGGLKLQLKQKGGIPVGVGSVNLQSSGKLPRKKS